MLQKLSSRPAGRIGVEVWEQYEKTRDPAIRNRIADEYLYIVRINSRRISAACRDRGDLEDIINQGAIALLECIDRYDYTKGVQFDTFASIRVRGSIIDYLRKQDWVPRDVRKKSLEISSAYNELQTSMGRSPTDEEVASHLGMPMEVYNNVMSRSGSFMLLSYEEQIYECESSSWEESSIKTPEQQFEDEELKEVLAEAIDELGEKERLVISLYYYEELKLKEIAVVLGLTPSRISQLHSRALMKIRQKLGNYI